MKAGVKLLENLSINKPWCIREIQKGRHCRLCALCPFLRPLHGRRIIYPSAAQPVRATWLSDGKIIFPGAGKAAPKIYGLRAEQVVYTCSSPSEMPFIAMLGERTQVKNCASAVPMHTHTPRERVIKLAEK